MTNYTLRHPKRLEKLAKFLDTLPRKRFDFRDVCRPSVEATRKGMRKTLATDCGSVGCAMGWAPTVFPGLIQGHTASQRFKIAGRIDMVYGSAAAELFGIDDHGVAWNLFSPGGFVPGVPTCYSRATPKQVAKRLRAFIRLAEKAKT